ncbi:MAG: hypothetical protein NZL83_03220 [Candidatus Absconditabacterales bacterium]|nr:hypothetical protein [Candidatus Absconditabacterales bacterium]
MHIIDLYQDRILSYIHDLGQWTSFSLKIYTADYPTNAGSCDDYLARGIHTIWGVVWPYTVQGNMADKATRKILFVQRQKKTLCWLSPMGERWIDTASASNQKE